MTQDEIKHDLLQVCKVKGWDGDFNILAFHVLCDKLKQLGAEEEREACALIGDSMDSLQDGAIGRAIRARGQA